MPPVLVAPDRQASYEPTWLFTCSEFPAVYSTRDIDVAAASGDPFITGESDTGGTDSVGGGAGPDDIQAYARIKGEPTITRKLTDAFWGTVEVQDVTIVFANADGALSGDYRVAACSLSRYDKVSGIRRIEWMGIIAHAQRDLGTFTVTGTNVDTAMLKDEIPKGGLVDATAFPQASAFGTRATWLFGNVTNLPLENVLDDVIGTRFDYRVQRGTSAAITGLRRVVPGGVTPFSEIGFLECEPYPGMDGIFVNGTMETWDAGAAAAPDGWTLGGVGASVAKNITAGQVAEGRASASLTNAVGQDARLQQMLPVNAPILPLSWWQGRELYITARVQVSAASRAFIRFSDGVTTTDSTFHTGGGAFETLILGSVGAPLIVNAAATTAIVHVRLSAGAVVTAQFDDVRIWLKAKSWAEVIREDLYPGYTAIRLYIRQDDGASLYQIVADVNGLQPERNAARALRTMWSDATHGLGRTVDAESFDAAEIAACLTYDAAVLLDGWQVYLSFRDTLDDEDGFSVVGNVARDRSGYGRHATATISSGDAYATPGPSGDPNDSYITGGSAYFAVPYDVRAGFDSPDVHAFKIWIYIDNTVVTGTDLPICEKRIGAAAKSGRFLELTGSQIVFGVRSNGGTLSTCGATLTAPADTQRWMLLEAVASGGVLSLYRDNGVLAASGTYPGALDTGDGLTVVGQWGTGIAVTPLTLRYARFAMGSTVVTPARVAAHFAAMALDVEPVSNYDALIMAEGPTFFYRMTEQFGSVVMADHVGPGTHTGAWTGGVELGVGVSGPLSSERGIVNVSGGARFVNNVAQYGVETGMTLAELSFWIGAWYRPAALGVNAGIVEKTIGGVRDTQWSLCQRRVGTTSVVRFTFVTSSGTYTVDAPLVAEDVGRWTWFAAFARNIDQTGGLYKDRAIAGSVFYAGSHVSGVGDLLVGVQGTNGGPRTRPGQGDIGRISYHPTGLDAAMIERFGIAGTWHNGGLAVDFAMTEARQAQDQLREVAQLRGIRFGFTALGALTCSVDAVAPATIRLEAAGGPGDGERTLVDIRARQRPSLGNAVRDVVVQYRLDFLSGEYLGELRRPVSTRLDAQGQRIGSDRTFRLPAVREHFAADRFACYMAARLRLDETVKVVLHQEARQLIEGDLVQVTHADMGYAVPAVMEVRSIDDKDLALVPATLGEWDESIYPYVPAALPSGAVSG